MNKETFKINPIFLGNNAERAIPTAISINRESGEIGFGQDAVADSEDVSDLLINWKILVGETKSEINKKSIEDPMLEKILRGYDYNFQSLLNEYIAFTLSKLQKYNFTEKPQIIVGVPPSTNQANSGWRARFKDQMENAFKAAGYPSPRLFPEPFAVFQYHWNKGDIPDEGAHQNIFVVDIGGGTTNVCMVQTTKHGRLARGGSNKIPHGVKTTMVGGATIDDLLLREFSGDEINKDPRALIKVSKAKEKISFMLRNPDSWVDHSLLNSTTAIVDSKSGLSISAMKIRDVISSRFWPSVLDTINQSLSEIASKKLSNPVEKFDLVILAGGTCQLSLMEYLFKRDVDKELFSGAKFLISPSYQSAVADGLALEAFANAQAYEIKPVRTAVYINEDIGFRVSHFRDELDIPFQLRVKGGDLSCDPQRGVLIKAPQNISPLIGKTIEWRFKLKQKPRDIYYKFIKIIPDSLQVSEEISVSANSLHLSRKSEDAPGASCCLLFTFQEDGSASAAFEFSTGDGKSVSKKVDFIDLHEVGVIGGDCFVGLDFGTSSTLCSYINGRASEIYEVMPQAYWVKQQAIARALALERKFRSAVGERSLDLIRMDSSRILPDYIYHSNKIEGSLLTRGQTERVLAAVESQAEMKANEVEGLISRISFVDASGRIQEVIRPIKDPLAAINLRDAFFYIQDLAFDDNCVFTKYHLRGVHALVMRGDDVSTPGVFRNKNVKISETSYVPPDFTQIEDNIDLMFVRFNSEPFKGQPAIIQAVEAHAWFVSIHPFHDGNGRVARLLVNYFLWRMALPGVSLAWENRDRYYDALEECNSKETSVRGDITDLAMLFCDSFEDYSESYERVKATVPDQALSSPVGMAGADGGSAFDKFLGRLSKRVISYSFEEQYPGWLASFDAAVATIKQLSESLSSKLGFLGGGVDMREYPSIEMDTYVAIRKHEKFSRTWRLKLTVSHGGKFQELVFYFGPSSYDAYEQDASLKDTCSLHISRYDYEKYSHVKIKSESWSRILEVVHSGAGLGVLVRQDGGGMVVKYGDFARVDEWFGVLMEDLFKGFFDLGAE